MESVSSTQGLTYAHACLDLPDISVKVSSNYVIRFNFQMIFLDLLNPTGNPPGVNPDQQLYIIIGASAAGGMLLLLLVCIALIVVVAVYLRRLQLRRQKILDQEKQKLVKKVSRERAFNFPFNRKFTVQQ